MTTALSSQQLNTFQLFGYLKLPGILAREIPGIASAFDRAFQEHHDNIVAWDHVVHSHRPRLILPQVADKCPEIHALLKDPRIVQVVTDILGKDYKFIGSDANIYECGTRWHTDIIGLPYNCKNVKLIFYLDPSQRNQDCFRVIPGSHFHTDKFAKLLKQHIREPQPSLGLDMKGIPCQQIPTVPGDIVVFDARVWHAVDYAGHRRRAFSFLFGDKNYQPPAEGNTHPVQVYD
jgi:ectoine hydroxylase-related dioxygenase (phytanoyl-CoA dioxygenase family)